MSCVLSYNDLIYDYPDGTHALNGVSFTIGHGEHVALLGPNGAGKSTLMLHANGVLMPTGGTVAVSDIELTKDTVKEIRERVGLVFQDPDDQLFMTTVYDDVAFGPLNMGLDAKEVEARADDALKAVSLTEVAHKSGNDLSFGQKKRVALATVLSMQPSILILDEPTSNLDPRSRRAMQELLDGMESSMLIATHDMDLVWDICPRSIIIDNGRVVADGPTKDLLRDEELLVAHGLELPAEVRFCG